MVRTYPHDPKAWCQGLVFAEGLLYEGTGRYGRSSLRRVDLASGRVLGLVRLNRNLFGEGVAAVGDELFQLTWKSQTCHIYDERTLRRRRFLHYTGEGWGLTFDGRHLIMSDGTANLRFLDPATLRPVRNLAVHNGGTPLNQLNELEYIEGEIYANVWKQDYIARISPDTGQIVGWIDLAGLLHPRLRQNDDAVLNGIAYLPAEKRLFVTGKLWPKLFEIRLTQK